MDGKNDVRSLPDSELKIMLVVWGGGKEGITAPEIMAALDAPLTASALHSYLKRLGEKGFLACAKHGKVNYYTALITKKRYQEQEGKSVLKKLYDNSIKRFAVALYDGGAVSKSDLEDLHKYLEELSRKN